MSSTTVEKIKEKLDIVDVVGSYLKLEKAGGNFKAKCPFHNEKTPSLFVSPGRGSFYCFGCGAKGDIFSFVEQFEGLDFYGALKVLANRAGVPLERENLQEKDERERLYDTLEAATDFFEKQLKGTGDALTYIKERGLSVKTISEWRIGFAPEEWRALRTHLLKVGYTDEEMLKVGLIKKNESNTSGEKYYDTFRGRIIFPIFDSSGRPVAFSGRILKTDDPTSAKYLNSPETELFKKSEIIYGLHRAKFAIRKLDFSILVEGQMDLVTSHQAGFVNTVASSGTALTISHLERLKKLSNRVIIAFDGDEAGFKAADRSAQLAMGLAMEVKLVALPSGSDPADLIKKDPKSFKSYLVSAKHIIDFHTDLLMVKKISERDLAREVVKKILPYVALLQSAVERSHYITVISEKTGIRQEALWNDLKKTTPVSLGRLETDDSKKIIKPETGRKDILLRQLVSLIFLEDKTDTSNKQDIKEKVIEIIGNDELERVLKDYSDKAQDLLFEAETYYGSSISRETDFAELIIGFEGEYLREELAGKVDELHKKEKGNDQGSVAVLLRESQEISKRIEALSKKKISG